MYHIATNTPAKPKHFKQTRTFSQPTTICSASSDESFLVLSDSSEEVLAEIEILEEFEESDTDSMFGKGNKRKSDPARKSLVLKKLRQSLSEVKRARGKLRKSLSEAKRALSALHLPLRQRAKTCDLQFAEDLPSPAFSVEIGCPSRTDHELSPSSKSSSSFAAEQHKDEPRPAPKRFLFNEFGTTGRGCVRQSEAPLQNIRKGILKLKHCRRARQHVRKDMEGVFQDDYQRTDAVRMPLLD